MLVENFEKAFNKEIKDFNANDYIKYEGNTAFVTLLRFQDGTKDELKQEDNWKYDTYFLMKYLMKQLETKTEIKNIVLNLAINGGGSVASMVRTLGFMTNKPILNREYDVLNRRADLSKSLVDTKGNDTYGQDAYTKYNWNLLVGINTFSAANQLTSIVKEMGIANIIGQRTGGGMSAIMPITLLDGTTVTISSPNNAVFGEKNESIEDGIVPDMQLPYDKFYDYKYIDSLLSKKNQ
nr:S41 family peptidase [Mycoplasma phocoeninasale]